MYFDSSLVIQQEYQFTVGGWIPDTLDKSLQVNGENIPGMKEGGK